jgi:hypothetical protein
MPLLKNLRNYIVTQFGVLEDMTSVYIKKDILMIVINLTTKGNGQQEKGKIT